MAVRKDYSFERMTYLVENCLGGASGQGRVDTSTYDVATHGAILSGPERPSEADIQAQEAADYAATHPSEFAESRGFFAQENDPQRLIR